MTRMEIDRVFWKQVAASWTEECEAWFVDDRVLNDSSYDDLDKMSLDFRIDL